MHDQEEQELKRRFKPSYVQRFLIESQIKEDFEREFCSKCENRDCAKCYIKLGVDSALNSVKSLSGELNPEVLERFKKELIDCSN